MNLEVLLAKEYKNRLRSWYWKYDFEKNPHIWGISFHSDKCYVLIDNIVKTKGWQKQKDIILAINKTCVHELIHLANIGSKELSERRTNQLENLLVLGIKCKLKNIIEV